MLNTFSAKNSYNRIVGISQSRGSLIENDSSFTLNQTKQLNIFESELVKGKISVAQCTGANNFLWRSYGSVVEDCRLSIRGNGNTVFFGGFSHISSADIRLVGENAIFFFGALSTVVSMTVLVMGPGEVAIGDSSMLSARILLDNSDHHGIYDLSTGSRLNYDSDIVVDHHVWIGRDVRVNKGARIGRDTVIGQGAHVNGILEPNSIYAGMPARKIRSGTTWSRVRAENLEEAQQSTRMKELNANLQVLQNRIARSHPQPAEI